MSTIVDSPVGQAPLVVEVRCRAQRLELAVRGSLDGATGRALVVDLIAAFEPGTTEVHIDLAAVHAIDRDGILALERCRSFAEAREAGFRVTGLRRNRRSLDLREPDAGA